jgi:hypothetical protein
MLLTTQDEIAIGHAQAAGVEAEFGPVVHDPTQEERLQRILKQMLPYVKRRNIPYQISVTSGQVTAKQGKQQSVVNACACADGHLYFTQPLLALMQPDTDTKGVNQDATLAMIMGHEMSHIELQHARKAVNQQIWTGLAAGKVLGKNSTSYAQYVVGTGISVLMSKHSRKDESAADEWGIRLMGKAGYDMRYAARALDRLGGGKLKGFDKYFATHPATPDRMERAHDLVQWLNEDPRRLQNDVKFVSQKRESDSIPQAYSKPTSGAQPASKIHGQIPNAPISYETNFGAPLLLQTQGKFRIVLSPIVGFARWASADVQADGDKLSLQRDNFSARFTRGSNVAMINDQTVTMGVACAVYNGVLYAPLGNIAAGLGADAKLTADSNAVEIMLDNRRVLLELK